MADENGLVVCTFLREIADRETDENPYPDRVAARGSIWFKKMSPLSIDQSVPAFVQYETIEGVLDPLGVMVTRTAATRPGVWLSAGVWGVSFQLEDDIKVKGFNILVTGSNDESNPIDLSIVAPHIPGPTDAVLVVKIPATIGADEVLVRGADNSFYGVPLASIGSGGDPAAAWAGTWLSTTDLNSIVTAGLYRQGSKTDATEARHYPVNDRGTLFVTQITAGGDVLQEYRAVGSVLGVSYYRERISSAWSEWMPIAPNRGPIPVGLSLDGMYLPQYRGTWRVTVGTHPGLPVASLGILEIVIADAGSVLQRFSAMPGARTWQRRVSGAGTAEAWQKLATIADIPTVPAPGEIPTSYPSLGILHAGLALATERPVGLVFAGSSTTGGSFATSDAKRYVNRLVTALRKRYTPDETAAPWVQHSSAAAFAPITTPGIHGYNTGLGGANASTYLTNAAMDNIASLNPWAIVHMIGSNDWATNRTISTYRSDVLAKLDYLDTSLTKPCVHVLAHSFGRWDVAGAYSWSLYGAALKEIADSRPHRVAYVDVSQAFAALGAPSSDPLDIISTDNIHANDLGHAILADAMARRLTSV